MAEIAGTCWEAAGAYCNVVCASRYLAGAQWIPARADTGEDRTLVAGDAADRQLAKARFRVIIVFGFWTSGVYLIAFAMAEAGDIHEWIVHFIFMVALLMMLNWALLSVRHWKERAGPGLITAALVFGI